MPLPVIEAFSGHLDMEAQIGGYEAEAAAEKALDGFYHSCAALIGGAAEEVAFMDSATRAWQAVFGAIDWRPGDEVLTARSEYVSHMIMFRQAERRLGIRVRLAPDTPDGEVDAEALGAMIGPRTRLICISHMPTNDGLVNPVHEVGAIARRHGLPFLLDACQSVGQIPVDVSEIGCTMLSATGRKYLRGPRGTGFLWVARDWAERLSPLGLDVKSAAWTSPDQFEVASGARRFELWERFVAGQIGLGVACAYAGEIGVEAIGARIADLAGHLREGLSEAPGITVWDQGRRRSGIVTFAHDAIPAPEVIAWLREEGGINTSLSTTQLTRGPLVERGVTQLVRASVHAFNTLDELDRLVELLGRLAVPERRPHHRIGRPLPSQP
jgi:cysteine desulfurase / selenocysteine lyase